MTENDVSSTIGNSKFWREFLELYKSLPVLWKVDSKEYCDRVLKAKAYEKMIEKLRKIEPDADRMTVVRKINSFRCNYRRDLKKAKQSQKSGNDGRTEFKSSLWYFELLGFLKNLEDCPERSKEKIPTPYGSSKTSRVNVEVSSNQTCAGLSHEATVQAEGWALQYSELSGRQKILARKLISDILYHGCLEQLNERHVREIETILDRSGRCSLTTICSESSFVSQPMQDDLDDDIKQETIDEGANEV